MKRLILLFSTIVIVFSLVGCGDDDANKKTKGGDGPMGKNITGPRW